MSRPAPEQVTRILNDLASGDRSAAAELLPLVYDEFDHLASAFFRDQSPGHTLQPTALVHEAFMKLSDRDDLQASSRGQFFTLASKVMRHVLVDHARAKKTAKRGGGWDRVTLSDFGTDADRQIDVLAMEEALIRLASPRSTSVTHDWSNSASSAV